jgi:hypothetical protein
MTCGEAGLLQRAEALVVTLGDGQVCLRELSAVSKRSRLPTGTGDALEVFNSARAQVISCARRRYLRNLKLVTTEQQWSPVWKVRAYIAAASLTSFHASRSFPSRAS